MNEIDYQVPFGFTGTLNKLTIKNRSAPRRSKSRSTRDPGGAERRALNFMTRGGQGRTNMLLALTAVLEAGAGVALLCRPSAAVWLLFGSPLGSDAAESMGRVTGAALLALGVGCWLSRHADAQSRAGRDMVAAMAVYNVAAALILAVAGTRSRPGGIALWPAVALHALMGGWCVARLLRRTQGRNGVTHT